MMTRCRSFGIASLRVQHFGPNDPALLGLGLVHTLTPRSLGQLFVLVVPPLRWFVLGSEFAQLVVGQAARFGPLGLAIACFGVAQSLGRTAAFRFRLHAFIVLAKDKAGNSKRPGQGPVAPALSFFRPPRNKINPPPDVRTAATTCSTLASTARGDSAVLAAVTAVRAESQRAGRGRSGTVSTRCAAACCRGPEPVWPAPCRRARSWRATRTSLRRG